MKGTATRRRGGLLGLLLGDAAGVPFEFHHPRDLARLPISTFSLPYTLGNSFARAHASVPSGYWSDDGAQALALLDSLDACDGLDLEDFAQRLVRWANEGEYAVDRRVFDVGIQTSRALKRVVKGVAPDSSGASARFENGNGALMRVLPLALWHRGSEKELVDWAHRQGLVTHGHAVSQVCCALYCLWAVQLLEGASDGFDEASVRLFEIYRACAQWHIHERELEDILNAPERDSPKGSGYVVDCLWSARHAFLSSNSFNEVVATAIAFGRDTDTTAAVAGGLAGVRVGEEGLPTAWLEDLAEDPSLARCLRSLS